MIENLFKIFTLEQLTLILALAGLVFGCGTILIAVADAIKSRLSGE